MNRIGLIVAGALLALMLLSSTLFVVDQRQLAVVYALGEIKEVVTDPGLKFKLPPPVSKRRLPRQAGADPGQSGNPADFHR